MTSSLRKTSARSRERGAIAVTAALWMMTIVIALGVVDVGHVWWQRRYLQGVADMMALAGAQRLDDTCGGPQSAVASIATANGYKGTYQAACGRFDTTSSTFSNVLPGALSYNAVNVLLGSNVKYWFMPMIGNKSMGIQVQSTARVVNIDTFMLGTALLSVQSGNSALLNSLLTGLLGSGSAVNLSLASYQALAAAQIKLGALAAQINSNGANDIVQMLASTPTLTTLLSAISHSLPATDASQSPLAQLATAALGGKGGSLVPMNGSNPTNASPPPVGLLDVGLKNKNGASNATVDALDLLMVAAMIANSHSGVVAPIGLSVSALNLPGIDPNQSAILIALGQPPVIATGEAGSSSAIARGSQVKLLVNLGLSVGGGVLPSLASVKLPLYVSVAGGQAALTKTQCGAGVSDSYASMSVTPSIVSACLGDGASNMFYGTSNSCGATVTLLSLLSNAITVTGAGGTLNVGPSGVTPISFTGVGHQITSMNPKVVTSNQVGSDLATALSTAPGSLLGNLATTLQLNAGPLPLPWLGSLVGLVANALSLLLQPALDGVVPPLLNALGAQVGTATVTDLSLTCGNVQLVQ